MISASEMAQIRADVANVACDLPCTVQRKTTTNDGMGGTSETWATVATCKAAMKQPTVGQLQNYDYLIGDLATWVVQVPFGTGVQRLDHLLISGETLVVQVELTPRSYSAMDTYLATEIKK